MKQRILTLPGGKWVRRLEPGQRWMHARPGDWVGHLTHFGRPPSYHEEQLHIWRDSERYQWWHAVSSGFGYAVMGSGKTIGKAVADLERLIEQKIKEVLNHGQA